jgi:hypothetical protein
MGVRGVYKGRVLSNLRNPPGYENNRRSEAVCFVATGPATKPGYEIAVLRSCPVSTQSMIVDHVLFI